MTIADLSHVASPSENAKNNIWNLQRKAGKSKLNKQMMHLRQGPSNSDILMSMDNYLLGPKYRTGFEFLIGSNCNKHQVKLKAKARKSSRRDRLKMFQRLQQKEPRIEIGHQD